MRHQKGFTLIELMIVIAFVGIIFVLIAAMITGLDNKVRMGAEGGTIEEPKTYILKCKDMEGMSVVTETAVPGERWRFEGGMYVTNDEYGNPRTVNIPSGSNCSVKTE